ncbi:MAG: cation:proton antiporter [Magnetococcus sp. DMHC-6]
MINNNVLFTLGVLFLIGFAADALARKIHLPRVTLLLICGLLLGPTGLDIVSQDNKIWLAIIAQSTLLMVGFILGGHITIAAFRRYGRMVLTISASVLLVTSGLTLAGMMMIGVPITGAILLASICTTTDPAAPADVVHELKADGPFSRILLTVIAINDALSFILFTILLSLGGFFYQGVTGRTSLGMAIWDLAGAVLLGAILGLILSFFTNIIRYPETLLAGILGLLTLCGGLAVHIHSSYFLAVMVMGSVTANVSRHPWKPFRIIERFWWPFLILFFLVAGANLEPESLSKIGLYGAVYVVCRMLGKTIGGWLGGTLSGALPIIRNWIGPALLPQAGVALSMTFIAIQKYPELKETLLPIVISGVMIFELIGPIFTRIALIRAEECNAPGGGKKQR